MLTDDLSVTVYEEFRQWRDIPLAELRQFIAGLIARSSHREVGRMLNLSGETVRQFADGAVRRPGRATVEKIGHYYLQHQAKAGRAN